jgi:copper chaperone CopZ
MEVGDLQGVSSVVASQADMTATITFEPPATEDQIKSLLSEINYPVAA